MITRSVGAQLRRPGRRGAQRFLSRFSRVSQETAAFPSSVLYPEGEESIRLHRSGTGELLLATRLYVADQLVLAAHGAPLVHCSALVRDENQLQAAHLSEVYYNLVSSCSVVYGMARVGARGRG